MSYLSDSEKRIIFSALAREKKICEKIDKENIGREGTTPLVPIVESLENKFYYDKFERDIERNIISKSEVKSKSLDKYTVKERQVNNVATAKVTMYVEADDINTLKDMERHMDYYIDFNDNPHITSVSGVTVETVEEKLESKNISENDNSLEIATILYEMSLDMDGDDYAEHKDTEINALAKELSALDSSSSLRKCLELISERNDFVLNPVSHSGR